MFRRDSSAYGEVDLLKEVQGSEGQDAAEEYEIIYSKGDVVGLKHNYKRYVNLSSLKFFQKISTITVTHSWKITSWIIERLDRKLADAIVSNIVEKCDVTLSRAIQPHSTFCASYVSSASYISLSLSSTIPMGHVLK